MKLLNLFPHLARKQEEIESEKRRFHRTIDKDIASQRRVNAVLDNGLALKVYKVLKHHG